MLLDAGNERPPAGQQLQHLRRLAGEGVYVIVLIPDARESEAMRLLDEGVADYPPYSFTVAALAVRLATVRRLLALQDEIRTDRALMTRSSDEWVRANRRLLHEALTDPLTQLPNRRYGLDRLNQKWEIASSNQLPIACLMLDIDHFKRVNDQYGHDIGDAVLRQMATVVERCCWRTDFVFRYGGEEFCVICPQTAQAEATLLDERIAAAIREQEFVLPNDVLHATLSVGVGVRAPAMNEAGQMLASADQALYAAKQAGRNRVVTAGDHLPARIRAQDRTEARMPG
jgi:diguanylate cyclase (GGDEF)-like protein